MRETQTLFQVPFFTGSKHDLLDTDIQNSLKKTHGSSSILTICTPNPEQVVLAQHSPEFLAALRAADICIPDGIGIVVASRLLALRGGVSVPVTQRIAGVDMLQEIVAVLPTQSALIIGGAPGEQQTLTIAGKEVQWILGYEDVSQPTEKEEREVRRAITAYRPQAVFIAFGAPHQELWMLRHRAFLEQHGVCVALVVGGAADMLSGKTVRAPIFIQSIGLEWFFRLVQQPWRWRRQLRLLTFMNMLGKELLS